MNRTNPYLFILIIIGVILACTREWDNPWDEYGSLDPRAWAPNNFTVEDISIVEKKLSWEFDDDNIEAFVVDRKIGENDWQMGYAILPRESRSWVDTAIIPEQSVKYKYKIYSVAGDYYSSDTTIIIDVSIPPPSKILLTRLSDKSIRLNWSDNSNAEQGFKIDKKLGYNSWENGYATLFANSTEYTDTNIYKSTNIEYRVYSYYKDCFSKKVNIDTNTHIPGPSEFNITYSTNSNIKLTWKDNCDSEQGFVIDRKINDGNWEIGYISLNPNQNQYFDDGLDLINNIYRYRLYAFINDYTSEKLEKIISLKCGFPFTDFRDGNEYQTVQIGSQCWMRDNLAWLPAVSDPYYGSESSPYYYVYGYNGNNVDHAKNRDEYEIYGVLYNWPATDGVCPEGWHMPDDDEWSDLVNFLGGSNVAGGKMKATGTIENGDGLWYDPNTGATNISGFSALPGGLRSYLGNFYMKGQFVWFWSSTLDSVYGSPSIWTRELRFNEEIFYRYPLGLESGHSVRCIRNE